MQQLLVRLPEKLAQLLKRRVPAQGRSAFVRRLLEGALPADEGKKDPLYLAAVASEQNEWLVAEVVDWDVAAGDGLPGGAEAPRHQ